jgi:hypothetical protein
MGTRKIVRSAQQYDLSDLPSNMIQQTHNFMSLKVDGKTTSINTNLHLQRLDRLPSNIFAIAKCFDPSLRHLFQYTHASDMRIRCISRAELTCTHGGPAAFRVVSRARVAACTSSEDGSLAGYKSGRGHEEDKLEARGSRNHGCHCESQASVNHHRQRLMDNGVKDFRPTKSGLEFGMLRVPEDQVVLIQL